MKQLNGTKITDVNVYYDNLLVFTDKGNFFLSPQDVMKMMNEFIFNVEKKITRTWLHPVTPDVNLLYDQEKYPEES